MALKVKKIINAAMFESWNLNNKNKFPEVFGNYKLGVYLFFNIVYFIILSIYRF